VINVARYTLCKIVGTLIRDDKKGEWCRYEDYKRLSGETLRELLVDVNKLRRIQHDTRKHTTDETEVG
jgi:hypothetical protein